MLKISSGILLLIILELFFVPLEAGAEEPVARQYNFRSYTAFDGLPQTQVLGIQQDKKGYLWLGSYSGITRYNGREFETFTDKLPNNLISSMIKDQSGRIIFTSGNGFCYLNNESFECTAINKQLPLSNLYASYSDTDNSLWFAGEGGVVHFKDGQPKLYGLNEGIPSLTVRSILKDSAGKVWAGTTRGLARLENRKFESFHPEIFADSLVRSLIDTDEGVWIGSNKGLYFSSHSNDKGSKQSSSNISQQLLTSSLQKIGGDVFDGEVILSLFEDSRDNLWIGTYSNLFRLVEGRLEKLSPQKGLLSKAIYTIMEDQEGTIWIGTDAGLVKYVPGPFVSYTTKQGLSDDFVRAMSVAPDGKIWMGTRHGVSIFDPNNESFETLTTELKSDRIRVYSLLSLGNESALIGTRAGLIHWKDNQMVKNYSSLDGLKSSYVSSILKDSKGRVWLGTSRGLSRWSNEKIQQVREAEFKVGAIFTMREDRLGRIWLGTRNHGLVLFEPDTESYSVIEKIPLLQNMTIWNIDFDSAGNLWIGTNGHGLLKISEQLELLESFDSNHELENDFVWQVKVDSKNNVWAYTNAGLKRYDGTRMYHYDGSDGLPDMEGAATAVLEHKNGDMWFGTGFGVTRYVPELEKFDLSPPPIYLEGAWLAGKRLNNHVVLPNEVSAITVNFSSPTFRSGKSIEYSFRLLGAAEEWSTPQNISSLQLASMSSGSYTLQVRAIKSNRIVSDEFATFSFTITPPFWKTWWFIFFGCIFGALIISLMIRRRVKKLGEDKKHLELVVAERTAELRSSNDELNRLVVTDELTKLANRRHLMDSLNRELALLSRSGGAAHLSFIILDVDFFKVINDTHGHRVGDQVLTKIAQRVAKCCRKSDIAARYGGEEFAIILPFTDISGALRCAEKIKKAISERKFEVESISLGITISLGIASIDHQSVKGGSSEFDQLIKNADAALYRAKEEGRNTVCTFDEQVDSFA